jgi:uncharacterized protein
MLVDTNVLIALLVPTHPFHAIVTTTLAHQPSLALCNSVQISLMRLLTTPALQQRYGIGAKSNSDVLEILAALRAHPQVTHLAEPPEVYGQWRLLAHHSEPAPRRWMDAYLAALALHHGVPIVTLDQGFAQYREHGVQVVVV